MGIKNVILKFLFKKYLLYELKYFNSFQFGGLFGRRPSLEERIKINNAVRNNCKLQFFYRKTFFFVFQLGWDYGDKSSRTRRYSLEHENQQGPSDETTKRQRCTSLQNEEHAH